MSTDSGLKAVICGKVELLIFTSLQLPEKLQSEFDNTLSVKSIYGLHALRYIVTL